MGNDDEMNRDADGVGLFLDQLSPDTMHRNSVVRLAETGDKLDDLKTWIALPDVVEGEDTIFSSAPMESGFLGGFVQ
jgi:hypothetical protein